MGVKAREIMATNLRDARVRLSGGEKIQQIMIDENHFGAKFSVELNSIKAMWQKWIPRHGWKWWFSNICTQFNFSQQNCMCTQYQFQQQITQFNRMNVSTFEHIAWCRQQKMMTVKCFLCGVRMQFSTWISLDNIFTPLLFTRTNFCSYNLPIEHLRGLMQFSCSQQSCWYFWVQCTLT